MTDLVTLKAKLPLINSYNLPKTINIQALLRNEDTLNLQSPAK